MTVKYDLTRRELTAAIDVGFQRVLDLDAEAAVVAVDIPIGLPEGHSRRCDLQARSVLGPRRSSVFPAPDRRLLAAYHYQEALALSRRLTGKGISKQTFAICHKIVGVDRLMTPELQARVVEIHPELCFRAMAGRRPLTHHKAKPEGFLERRALLLAAYEGIQIPNLEEAASLVPPAHADDVLDGMAAAWTASRVAQGLASRLPADPPTDTRGLGWRWCTEGPDIADMRRVRIVLTRPGHLSATISIPRMAKIFPFASLATADLVVDGVYEGGTKGNAADDPLGKLLPGAGNQGGFRSVGSWNAPSVVILSVQRELGAQPRLNRSCGSRCSTMSL